MTPKLLLLGEYNPTWETHRATDDAIVHSGRALGIAVRAEWQSTGSVTAQQMEEADGFWISTGGPYRSMERALDVIRHARLKEIPCLGTCQGFQHLMLEFARAFLGLQAPGHAEYDRNVERPFISALACSLRGKEAEVHLAKGTLTATAYGSPHAREHFYCRFGIHPDFVASVHGSDRIRVAGVDSRREIRIVEYPGHPFMVGTLFVPQARSRPDSPHPLITKFLEAVARFSADRISRSLRRPATAGQSAQGKGTP